MQACFLAPAGWHCNWRRTRPWEPLWGTHWRKRKRAYNSTRTWWNRPNRASSKPTETRGLSFGISLPCEDQPQKKSENRDRSKTTLPIFGHHPALRVKSDKTDVSCFIKVSLQHLEEITAKEWKFLSSKQVVMRCLLYKVSTIRLKLEGPHLYNEGELFEKLFR